MATTSNFGWNTPDDTDLVKDGALAIRTLGNNIDTSLVDLKGGTTGQILSKNSNTDLDYTWINNDQGDITAVTAGTGISGGGTTGAVTITNDMATTITAKGDIVAGTGNATYDNLAAGSNGETLVADSSTTTGLRWQADWNTGKNKIINGDFGIWQRGTSFSALAQLGYYADRWRANWTAGGASNTFSRQTFTPGAAPVAGYEGAFFARAAATSGGASTQIGHAQAVEDVRTLAGQTVTLSYWAKADTNRTLTYYIEQNFGSGGSAAVSISGLSTQAITTSWTRYSVTFAFPSISGKTIGTSSFLDLIFYLAPGAATGSPALDIWGVQLEAGSVATPFTTATGTLQGELAACQRYYYRRTANATNTYMALTEWGTGTGTSNAVLPLVLPVPMRIVPTVIEYSTSLRIHDGTGAVGGTPTLSFTTIYNGASVAYINYQTTSTGITQYRPYQLQANNDATAYVGVSAEL